MKQYNIITLFSLRFQSKNVEEKAVWDQPSYMNQNHEPVWASKDNSKQNATSKIKNFFFKQNIFHLNFYVKFYFR